MTGHFRGGGDTGIPEFVPFPKIGRLNRNAIITEKIDGTNAQVHIWRDETLCRGWAESDLEHANHGELRIIAGSRKRWITPGDDNFGFAAWVQEHRTELIEGLGEGTHFGEWWGSGIQRGYGLPAGEKRFSLFNVGRWVQSWRVANDGTVYRHPLLEGQQYAPDLCWVVPVLARCEPDDINVYVQQLYMEGSRAAPGFTEPEGIIAYHTAARMMFKVTCEKDSEWKGK